jgi:hypothetical protein
MSFRAIGTVCATVLLYVSTLVDAATYNYSLTGLFDDGGTLSGSFVFDTDTSAYTDVNITTTAGSTLPGGIFGSGSGDSYGFAATIPSTNLFLDFFPEVNGNASVTMYGNQTYPTLNQVRSIERGEAVLASLAPVPVPTTAYLFGSGLLGLIGIARRKNAA